VYLRPYGLRGIISVAPTSALVIIGTLIGDHVRGEGSSRLRTAARILVAGGWLYTVVFIAFWWLILLRSGAETGVLQGAAAGCFSPHCGRSSAWRQVRVFRGD